MSNFHNDDLTPEQALLKDLVRALEQKESQVVNVLVLGGFENEAGARELVGQIRAYRDVREAFKHIVSKYFPS